MTRVVLIGEAMTELSGTGELRRVSYGGDTLNTAIHLARRGCDVAYLTALGRDPFSEGMRAAWAAEGLDTSLVLDHPTRTSGLYAISTDAEGERSFTYWRDNSAARDLFSLPGINAALAEAEKADLVVYSLITLAILPEAARTRLLALNARVAFDSNYRPRLWPDATTAATVRDAAIARASIGLPTLEDEIQMSGETTADAVGLNWQSRGCIETVVKMGVMGCRLPVGDIIAPTKRLSPIDTSGAGDAFNAGYLHARMFGATPTEAAKEGNYLAGQVLNHPGAIPLFSV